jgi:hypothetical protein
MSNDKTFTVAGTATNADGTVKVRFANDLVARIKILNKAGCSNINLVELPQAMTKLEALQYLQAQGITGGDEGYAVANKLAEKEQGSQERRSQGLCQGCPGQVCSCNCSIRCS